jgi:hypothetical protein
VGLLRPPVLLVCKPDTVNYNMQNKKRNVHVFIEHACMELVNKQRERKKKKKKKMHVRTGRLPMMKE